ncbi:hypothetical protein MHB42_02580 [Lysinibacillus sp. FSL K6-0232]|uniref:hypothetical protein n=1 Tax=unclassified Lysinibacillus TaxID=2636778 RepID=UPI0030FB7509
MRFLSIVIAITISAFLAVGIAEYYHQPYDWYLIFLMVLFGFFIHIIVLILESEKSEENEY